MTGWLVVPAMLLEAFSLYQLSLNPTGWGMASPALFHVFACVLFAIGLSRLLPQAYRQHPVRTGSLLFLLTVFIPGFGMPGVLLALVPGLWLPTTGNIDTLRSYNVPDLPFKPYEPDQSLRLVPGNSYDILKHSQDSDKKLAIVRAAGRMADQFGIPILKRALRDEDEEVRLLAFALLDQQESDFNTLINQYYSELARASVQHATILHKRLASLYWELAYLRLVEGNIEQHALRKSREHCEAALVNDNDPATHFLLGRVALKTGDTMLSEHHIGLARDGQYPLSDCIPYLAECAFRRRDFAAVTALLEQLPSQLKNRPPLGAISEYWLRSGTA